MCRLSVLLVGDAKFKRGEMDEGSKVEADVVEGMVKRMETRKANLGLSG